MPYIGKKPADIIATVIDTTTGTFSGEVDAGSLDVSGNADIDGITNLDNTDIDGTLDVSGNLTVDTNTLFVDATNNSVGVGTSSPQRPLHIAGTNNAFVRIQDTDNNADTDGLIGGLEIRGADGVNAGIFQFSSNLNRDIDIGNETSTGALDFRTNSTQRMRIDSSGNVGIGTDSPTEKLDLVGGSLRIQRGSDTDTIVRLDGADGSTEYLGLGIASGNGVITGGGVGSTNTGLVFKTATSGTETERMRITAEGRVMIAETSNSGYSNNADDLIVGDNGASTERGISLGSTTGASIRFNDGADSGSIEYVHSSNHMLFVTNGSERMRIDSSGNVGIGVVPETWTTSLSTRALQVGDVTSIHEVASEYSRFASNMYYDGAFKYITSNPATRYTQQGGTHVWDYASSGSADGAISFNEAMRIDSSGNVGIGVTSLTQKLEVAGKGVFSTANPDVNGLKITATTGTNASAMTFSNTATAYVGLDNSVGGRISGVSYGLAVWNASAYPVVFGTNNTKRMTIDSAGHVTMPYQPAFHAYNNVTQTNFSVNNTHVVAFNTEIYDQNGDFASNTFTAPVTGKYFLTANLGLLNIDIDASYLFIKISTSNRDYLIIKDFRALDFDATYWSQSVTAVADMDAGDTATVQLRINGGASQTDLETNQAYTYFSGYLLG